MARSRTRDRSFGREAIGIAAAIRDNTAIANTDFDVLYSPMSFPVIRSRPVVSGVDDNREWRPFRPAPMLFSGGVASRRVASGLPGTQIRPSIPSRVALCVRRATRREVLFAKGRGGRGHRRAKWSANSYWRC